MTRIQFGHSSCQIEGAYVPVADMKLAAGDRVYFGHHSLLWQDASVQLSQLPLRSGWSRMMAGMPIVMLEASGPGHIAFSHDAPGEVLAVPLQAGGAVDVHENHFLVATSQVGYDWLDSGVWFATAGGHREKTGLKLLKMGLDMALDSDGGGGDGGDNETEWHYPMGRYLDRFTAGADPGLLLIHAAGNAFVRPLGDGEAILVKPPAFLWKDPTVRSQLHIEHPSAGFTMWRSWGNRYLWLRLYGPGRVAVQSCYESEEDPGTDFQSVSDHTEFQW
jgi:uncharacterized protein (AIM24 family)